MHAKTYKRPKLSSSMIYTSSAMMKKTTYKTEGTLCTTVGIIAIIFIGFILMWKYQKKQVDLQLIKNAESNIPSNAWNTRNRMIDIQNQQDNAYREMQNHYYMNNMNPQQKVQYIIKQNQPGEVEEYIDESIAQRAARAKYL